MFEGSSRNGAQQIDRDGLYSEFFESKGEFDALLHRFSHADNTSATDVHAYLPCGAQGSELLLLRMGRAKPGKIGRSCFQVAMIAGDTGVIQSTKFIFFQQA